MRKNAVQILYVPEKHMQRRQNIANSQIEAEQAEDGKEKSRIMARKRHMIQRGNREHDGGG